MSVKPATDEQAGCACLRVEYQPARARGMVRERWACSLCGAEFHRVTGAIARIEAERTRAEEAEALLREALDYVQSSTDGTRARRDTIARIEAHLQEHTE